MRRRRLILAALLLVAAVAVTTGLWIAEDWPPPLLLVEHGRPPAGGPTGRRRTVGGIDLIELSAGYYRMGSHEECVKGDLPGRVCGPLGLPWGTPPKHGGPGCPTRWVEIPEPIWVATGEVTNEALARLDPGWAPRDDRVAVGVSFERADAFCRKLTERGGGLVFRLPTEEEWEYPFHVGHEPGNPPSLPGFPGSVHEWCAGRAGRPGRALRDYAPAPRWPGPVLAARVDGVRPGGHFFRAGFRPVAAEGGPAPPPPPENRFPLDRWHPVALGDLARIHAERALYEREGSDRFFFVRFAVENVSGRRIGVDLAAYWCVPGPNQWGGLDEPFRGIINEGTIDPGAFEAEERAALRDAFGAGRLATIPPGGVLEYYRGFNASGRADVDATEGPFLFVSVPGVLPVTDGAATERIPVPDDEYNAISDPLILTTPVRWGRVPAGARVVEYR